MASSAPGTSNDPVKGFTFAFMGMCLLSCNYVLAKIGLEAFNPETFAFFWMGLATVFGLGLLLARGQARQILVRRGQRRWMLAMGLANTACQLLMWQGLSRLDPSFASFLGRFQPVMTILLCVAAMNERIRPAEWLAIGVMIAGGAASSLEGTFRAEALGIVLILSSSFFGAVQWTIGKHLAGQVSSQVLNFYRVSLPAAVTLALALAAGRFDVSRADAWHWSAVAIGSFCGPFLSYVFMFRSGQFWNMSRSAIVMTLQPLVVIPMAYLLMHKVITGWKLGGGIVILAGGLCLAALHRNDEAASIDVPPLPDPADPTNPLDPAGPPGEPQPVGADGKAA
ncbi:MAG: DMT family transporter [Planctomycetota bacterium]|nr:DMT family transporter [Planctomycetota bacterium]